MINQKSVELTPEQSLQICIDDFFQTLKEASEQAGGSGRCSPTMTMLDLAKMLAPNGVRFTHYPQRTITNVKCYTGFFPPEPTPPVKKRTKDDVDLSIFSPRGRSACSIESGNSSDPNGLG